MYKYFYLLGHESQLSIAEYEFLTQDKLYEVRGKWLLSNSLLDTKLTGSLVFGGETVAMGNLPLHREGLFEELKTYLLAHPGEFKKVGLLLPKDLGQMGLQVAKDCGSRKINILTDKELPNYGHFKQTKNWVIYFRFGYSWYLGRVTSVVNQEFWAELDRGLPKGEMSRGLINLKLGRTLLNLSHAQTIWDPFCGAGRLVMAGLDLKQGCLASDIAPQCVDETKENYKFSLNFWKKEDYRLQNIQNGVPNTENIESKKDTVKIEARSFTVLYEVRVHDATEKLPPDFWSKTGLDSKNVTMVTEGYLGTNFKQQPTISQIKEEFTKLEKLWQKVLQQSQEAEISELVFCLPFYKLTEGIQAKPKLMLPDFLERLIEGTEYKFYDFQGQNYLLYSRERSWVGHLIIKLSN